MITAVQSARVFWLAKHSCERRRVMGADSILTLEYAMNSRLRYSQDPKLHLTEHSTREDVRAVRHLLPMVNGIGPKSLAIIDAWLDEKGGA
jgi:hypothetical protein